MRRELLSIIHESHLGMEKCKSRARQVIYWPGMSGDIESMVAKCSTYAKLRARNHREPLHPHPIPSCPWKKLGADIFEFKARDYLIIIDYFSKYPEVCEMKDKTAKTVVHHLNFLPITCRLQAGRCASLLRNGVSPYRRLAQPIHSQME